MPINNIRNVSKIAEFSSVSDENQNIVGEINFHGEKIPVYSMRRIFGFPERPPNPSDILIFASVGDINVALWADRTINVKEGSEVPPDSGDFPGLHITIDGEVIIHDIDTFLKSGDYGDLYEKLARTFSFSDGAKNESVISIPKSSDDPEMNRMILAGRAKQLAKPGGKTEDGSPIDILTFRLMYTEYAIEMNYIREVTIHDEITPVPGTPEHIAGICAVRGEIISLVDLRILFDLPEKGLTDLNRVIVLTNDEITFGILADYITDIGTITAEEISPVAKNNGSCMDRYTKGIVGDSIIMLDAGIILSDPAMVVDDT